jgi:hypothetical protein
MGGNLIKSWRHLVGLLRHKEQHRSRAGQFVVIVALGTTLSMVVVVALAGLIWALLYIWGVLALG